MMPIAPKYMLANLFSSKPPTFSVILITSLMDKITNFNNQSQAFNVTLLLHTTATVPTASSNSPMISMPWSEVA
jgi:hypothetical protein